MHKAKECRRFGKRAAFGYQCRNAPFGVYREVFGAPLALRAKIDQNRLVRRASLFQRDVRRKRTRTGGVKKSEHVVRPSIDHAPRSARRPFGRHSVGGGRAVSPCDAIRVKLSITAGLPPNRDRLTWLGPRQTVISEHRKPWEKTMTDDAAWSLAWHVSRTGFADLPASAVESARRDILDTFGCMLGGSGSPGIDELFAVIAWWAGAGKAVCCCGAPACRRHRRRC